VNIDVLIQTIEETFETPDRDKYEDPLMFVARSFDINKPGSDPMKMIGGILGGALTAGVLKIGDEIELRPGRRYEKGNKMVYDPIITTITGLKTGGDPVEEIFPGGSVGVMTTLDPSIVKSDALTGNLVGHKGKLPPIIEDLKLEVHLLKRVVGAKDELEVEPLKIGEPLMLNVNSASTVGMITKMGKGITECKLKLAICAVPGSRVTISRRVANRFRLIGYGVIKE
jgi:translation initiation factor 2 subunit 3